MVQPGTRLRVEEVGETKSQGVYWFVQYSRSISFHKTEHTCETGKKKDISFIYLFIYLFFINNNNIRKLKK